MSGGAQHGPHGGRDGSVRGRMPVFVEALHVFWSVLLLR